MISHPILQLARIHLTGSRIRHVPAVAAGDFHEAVARYGAGIDHPAGEVPLALITMKLDQRAAAKGYSLNYVVTDRRLFGRVEASNVPLVFTEVPYAYVSGVPAKPGGLAQSVTVPLGGQQRKLYLTPKELHAYFAGMAASVPPAHRTFGPAAPPPTGPQDPIGALAATQAVGTPDTRTWVPLRALAEAHRRAAISAEDAAALVPQMILLARSVAYGRGSSRQQWLSVLPRDVLGLALRAALGAPAAHYPAPAADTFDFAIGAGSGKGTAVASSVVGLAALATLGVGWISTSHGHRLASIRVHAVDAPGGSALQLFGTSGAHWDALSLHWWRAVDVIHQALLRLEARYLLARAVFGPSRSPQELLTAPREALEPATGQLLGPTNLAMFYSG
jgi:hypothetical protein